MKYMITYQKANGQVFFRTRKTLSSLSVGDITSMGWLILDIHEEYEGNWLHHEDIRRFTRQKAYKQPLKKRIIRAIVRRLNKYA